MDVYVCVFLSSVCDISSHLRFTINRQFLCFVYLQGHDLVFLFGFAFFFGILQPFDELLHLLQEVHLTLV